MFGHRPEFRTKKKPVQLHPTHPIVERCNNEDKDPLPLVVLVTAQYCSVSIVFIDSVVFYEEK